MKYGIMRFQRIDLKPDGKVWRRPSRKATELELVRRMQLSGALLLEISSNLGQQATPVLQPLVLYSWNNLRRDCTLHTRGSSGRILPCSNLFYINLSNQPTPTPKTAIIENMEVPTGQKLMTNSRLNIFL